MGQSQDDTKPALDASQRRIRGFSADSVKAEGDGYSWTISTAAVDRDRDTLAVDGWDLTDYRKNPVVLWAHDSRMPPIARAESILATAGALKARTVFPDAGVYPLADTVKALVAGGFIKSTSVGFLPLEWMFNEKRGGIDFRKQSLLEFSLVPVPSNPEALMDAKRSGLDMAPVKAWAEGVLDVMEPGLWLPKEQAAAAMKALSGPRIVVPATFEKALTTAVEKSGRTLSAANVSRISSALTSIEDSAEGIGAAVEALEEVLNLATPATGDEPEKAVEPFVLVLPNAPAAEPTFLVDPNDVKAAARAAVSETVRALVNAGRGRID